MFRCCCCFSRFFFKYFAQWTWRMSRHLTYTVQQTLFKWICYHLFLFICSFFSISLSFFGIWNKTSFCISFPYFIAEWIITILFFKRRMIFFYYYHNKPISEEIFIKGAAVEKRRKKSWYVVVPLMVFISY